MSAFLALTQLASAGDVLWYTGHSSPIGTAHTDFDSAMTGAGSSGVDATTSWPSSLSGYKVIVLAVSSTSFSSSETSDLDSFVTGGGILVLMGEATGYNSAHVTVFNTLLSDLGLDSYFDSSASLDSSCGRTASAATSHALNDGASYIDYAYSGSVTVGSSATELYTGVSSQALVAYEDGVVLAADSNLFDDSCGFTNDNEIFFANLYEGVCEDPNTDDDGDGYISQACGGDDCNDADADINPDGDEVCDGADNDCDGDIDDDDSDVDVSGGSTFYGDSDGDGYGDPDTTTLSCDATRGYVANDEDCDDTDADVCPGCAERESSTECMADLDADGYGDDDPGDGVTAGSDCDDSTSLICPGCAPLDSSTECMIDLDRDGYGDASPDSWVTPGSDCDDSTDLICPGCAIRDSSTECMADLDGDDYGDSSPAAGVTAGNDCDDSTSLICPGCAERESSTDCMADLDQDGYGDDSPDAGVTAGSDCDDSSTLFNPDVDELCNSLDDDCDGDIDEEALDATEYYADEDGDGFGSSSNSVLECSQPSNYIEDATDCDDTSADAYPGGTEVCDGLDNDCNGTTDDDDAADAPVWYYDSDGDGYGDELDAITSCDQPSSYSADAGDCNDDLFSVNPDAEELCNEQDDNCDGITDDDATDQGVYYLDADGDGYGDINTAEEACEPSAGYVVDDSDCDDADPSVWTDTPGLASSCVDESTDPDEDAGKGCSSTGGTSGGWLLGLVGMLGMVGRRRR